MELTTKDTKIDFSLKISEIKGLIDNENQTLHIKLHKLHKPYRLSGYIEYSNGLKYNFFDSVTRFSYYSKEDSFEYMLEKLKKYILKMNNGTNINEKLYSITWKYRNSDELYINTIWAKHIILLIEKFHFRDFENPRDILKISIVD